MGRLHASLRSGRCAVVSLFMGRLHASLRSGRCAVVSLFMGRLHAPLPPVAALSSPVLIRGGSPGAVAARRRVGTARPVARRCARDWPVGSTKPGVESTLRRKLPSCSVSPHTASYTRRRSPRVNGSSRNAVAKGRVLELRARALDTVGDHACVVERERRAVDAADAFDGEVVDGPEPRVGRRRNPRRHRSARRNRRTRPRPHACGDRDRVCRTSAAVRGARARRRRRRSRRARPSPPAARASPRRRAPRRARRSRRATPTDRDTDGPLRSTSRTASRPARTVNRTTSTVTATCG